MDEIVDIVDEEDKIIGHELKSRCHSNMILHRGTAILVFKDNSYAKTIIQKRSIKKTSNPGKYCIPGGHISSGEDYITGAKKGVTRRTFSQTGIT